MCVWGSSRLGIGGTTLVILGLVLVYMIRSPLTGIHRDTVSRWAAAVEVGAHSTRVNLFEWRGSASYHSLEILREEYKLLPLGLATMEDLSNLTAAVEHTVKIVCSEVPRNLWSGARIRLFVNTPGAGHSWDAHLPENQASLMSSTKIQESHAKMRRHVHLIAQNTVIQIEELTIDLPSSDRCRYAWEAATYLLHHDDVRQPHIGMIDWGENNMHIAYYSPEEDKLLVEYHEHMGLFEARRKFFALTKGLGVHDTGACTWSVDEQNTWNECLVAIQRVFLMNPKLSEPDADCSSQGTNCKVATIEIPSLKHTKFVALRLFYSLLAFANVTSQMTNLAQLAELGQKYCTLPAAFNVSNNAAIDLKLVDQPRMLGIDVKESAGLATSAISCFDFAYVTAVLHHGLGFPMTDEAFLYKDGSGDIAGKRDEIWLMGAIIFGIRDPKIATETWGIDPGYTGYYLWGFQMMIVGLVYALVRRQCTVVLLHVNPRAYRDEERRKLLTDTDQESSHELDITEMELISAAHQRSRAGEILKDQSKMFGAEERTLVRSGSTSALPQHKHKMSSRLPSEHRRNNSDGELETSSRNAGGSRSNIELGLRSDDLEDPPTRQHLTRSVSRDRLH